MSQKTEVVITARDDTRAAIASAQRGLQSLSASAAGLRNSFSFLGSVGGLGGLIGGAALTATVGEAINNLDKLNDSVERLGISAEDLSALNFAGKLNGVEADEMAEALKRLSVKMKDAADGGKESGKLFEALGIKVTDASGRLKSADSVFAEVAESFAGMEDGAGKTAIAVEAFGKAGAKLVPVLNGGADGLKKSREEAGRLGAIMDGKLVKQAAEFSDNMDRLKTVSAAAGIAIASDLLPWLTRLSEEFLIGIKNSDGFFSALSAFGTLNPFKNTSENLATVRADMAKMESDLKEFGYLDEARYNRKKTQLAYLKDLQLKEVLAGSEGNYGNEGRGATQSQAKRAAPSLADPDKPKKTGGGGLARAQADDAARLLESLREKIALNEADLQSTGKMTSAEKEAAKVKYLLEAGTLKATGAQREAIFASLESLSVLEKSLAAQEEYRKALESQESTNVKNSRAMIEQIEAAEKAADLYGLSASQISAVAESHLEDAIALASLNGAYPEHIAFMEEELAMVKKLGAAQEGGDLKALLAGTKSAQEAARAAKVATLDRALAAGKIDPEQYKEALSGIKDSVSELDEFTVSAARNMQSAFADFLFDPFAEGINQMGYKFAQTVQRMAAEALSAMLMKKLLGDYATGGKTGDSGLIGAGVGWLAKAFGFHEGGIVGESGAASFTRAVPASMFLKAPRFHNGGLVGDEVPAILKPGELVLTKEQQRGMSGAAANQPAQNIRIVNAFDSQFIGDYLGSAAGERVIMNAVQRNASAFRQALA